MHFWRLVIVFALGSGCTRGRPTNIELYEDERNVVRRDDDPARFEQEELWGREIDGNDTKPGDQEGLHSEAMPIAKSASQSKIWEKNMAERVKAHARRRVIADITTVRVEPSRQAHVIAQLTRGSLVHVQSTENGWAKLKSGGFVKVEDLADSTQNPPE